MVESKKALPKEPRPSFYGGFGHHHPLSGAYYHPQRPGAPNFYNQLPCNSMYRPYENQSPGSEHHPNYIFDNRYFRYPRANGRNNINNDSSSGGSNGSNTALYEPDARGSYSHSRTMDHLYAQHNSNNNISSSNNNNTQQQQHQQQHHHHYRALSSSTAAPLLSSSVISHHLSTSSNRNNDLRSEEAVAASYYLALDNYIQAGGDSGENYEEDFPELTSKFSQFRFGGGEEGSEPLEQGDEEEGRHSVTQTEDSAGSNSPRSNVNNHYGF
ncbi:RNAbinding protein Musashi -like protein Rbp6like [Caligus rogercresseyi]|uniref:RNAbinding protein Musashi -like protein Rbp6like n=1 Tax=Caligus rogercresseyi TaxID=217165 RepID=A0A7T8HFP7_CALRO|nr:RNAbinding protein Musashi -like protein Rbp6like [Caligus rogercresseyi]